MTLDVAAQQKAALELTGKIAANPALAAPILKLLEQAGGNPEKLQSLTPEALLAVRDALPVASGKLSASVRNYDDTRNGFVPLSAIDFTATQDRQIKAGDLLTEFLGKKDAATLISDWGNRVDFSKNAPGTNQVALFLDSNSKARNRDYAEKNAKTTQEEDFKGAGLEFADDMQATIVCAALVKKAKDAGLDLAKEASSWAQNQPEAVGKLDATELDLFSKLRYGAVRSRSGALRLYVNGRLRARDIYGASDASYWAFGGVPPAE